jgi:hypothetical protein
MYGLLKRCWKKKHQAPCRLQHSFSFINSSQRNVECFTTCYFFPFVPKQSASPSSHKKTFSSSAKQPSLFSSRSSSFVFSNRNEPVGYFTARRCQESKQKFKLLINKFKICIQYERKKFCEKNLSDFKL